MICPQQLCDTLYAAMLKDLDVTHARSEEPCAEVSKCFEISLKYWQVIEHYFSGKGFGSVDEEIRFFRYWKPVFTAQVEYYSLVYHALLFCPDDYIDAMRFWQREVTRMQDFIYTNRGFYHWYHSGDTEGELPWFRSGQTIRLDYPVQLNVLAGSRLRSSHDRLAASLLASEKYLGYAEEQVVTDVVIEQMN